MIWTADTVKERLREAAATAYCLPADKNLWPAGYASSWPQIVHEAIDVWWSYDRINPPIVKAPRATSRQIDEMDEAMGWLELIEMPRRRWIVLHRSARWSYPRMRRVTGLSREWLRQHYDKGIDEIVKKLGAPAMKSPKNRTRHFGPKLA